MATSAIHNTGASVHSIDHFALNVPSLADAQRFFTAFGLTVTLEGQPAQALELQAQDGHRWARILPAAAKSLAYLCLSCYEADLDSIRVQVETAGGILTPEPAQSDGSGLGFWFHDPDGNLIHVKVGPKTSPCTKKISSVTGSAADLRGAPVRGMVETVRPRRLSHVLLFTPDVLAALDFYRRALGLRLSDKSQDLIAFTHAPHGSDHHLLAFAKSTARGWHHCAWDVDNVNLVGAGAAQMAAAGFHAGWGTGRHVLGSNYFHYVRDPWGSYSEYSADIDFISAGHAWPAGDFAPHDSLYLWGPDVPPDFSQNTEVAAALSNSSVRRAVGVAP